MFWFGSWSPLRADVTSEAFKKTPEVPLNGEDAMKNCNIILRNKDLFRIPDHRNMLRPKMLNSFIGLCSFNFSEEVVLNRF